MRKFFSRFAAAVVQAAPIGSLLALILFYIAVLSAELLRAEISVQVWLAALVALHVFSLAVMTLYIFAAGTHKYDSDIVGSSFVGFSKKCRSFDRALELHFNHRVTTSLDEFKLLAEEQSDRMTTDEKAIVSFYTGRCYEQLGFYPNALICYERAAEQGFRNCIRRDVRAQTATPSRLSRCMRRCSVTPTAHSATMCTSISAECTSTATSPPRL